MQSAARSFYILTFGCKVNQYESEALDEAWTALGGKAAASPADADLVLINSCAVTAMAVSDLRQAVRRLHREAPRAAIVITGCAASRAARGAERPGEVLADLPGVTGLVDARRKDALLSFITSPEFPVPSGGPGRFLRCRMAVRTGALIVLCRCREGRRAAAPCLTSSQRHGGCLRPDMLKS